MCRTHIKTSKQRNTDSISGPRKDTNKEVQEMGRVTTVKMPILAKFKNKFNLASIKIRESFSR